MIRTMKVLFCDNEHGTGDVTFPDLQHYVDPQEVINAPTIKMLRMKAREAGWRHRKGRDWCPDCVDNGDTN